MGSYPDVGHCGPPPHWPKRRIVPAIWEAVMTEPRDMHRDGETEPAPADPVLEVTPELIKDLDVTGDDAYNIAGGCSWTNTTELQ
jgi:hypothetical protein